MPHYRSRAIGDVITDPDHHAHPDLFGDAIPFTYPHAHGKSTPVDRAVDQPKPYVDPVSELRDAVALADAVKSNPYATNHDVLTVCAAIHGPASRYLAALDDLEQAVDDLRAAFRRADNDYTGFGWRQFINDARALLDN